MAEISVKAYNHEASGTLRQYLNENSFVLYQDMIEYIRKELKVPQYSAMFEDKEQFEKETKALFDENPGLESKIGLLKAVIEQLLQIVECDKDITFSFVVFQGFKELGSATVKAYRSLNVLREVKSSFDPSFDEEKQIIHTL